MPATNTKVRQKGAPGLPGAGRPKGSLSRRTLMIRAAAEGALKPGKTPLDIMLKNMYFYDDKADKLLDDLVSKLQSSKKSSPTELVELLSELNSFRMSAQKCACEAAPFVHPKLSSQDVNVTTETVVKPGGDMTAEQRADYYQKLRMRPTSHKPLAITLDNETGDLVPEDVD